MPSTTFNPGEHKNTMGLRCSPTRRSDVVTFSFPNRIHMTPIDCLKFDFGKPGGGGIGLAVDLGSEATIRHTSGETEVECDEPRCVPIVRHYVEICREIFSLRDSFVITLSMPKDVVRIHHGLGSSVSVACAVMQGINRMYGDQLNIEQIRRLIAINFVEEVEGKLARGLETGVGTAVVLKGGIAVIGDDIIELYRRSVPAEYSCVYLVFPTTTRPDIDKPESEAMLKRTFYLDGSYRYIKAYNIMMEIIPAIERGDYGALGDQVWDIQFSGTHLSMIQSYVNNGIEIYNVLCNLRSKGASVVGLSSVGPTVYAIVGDKRRSQVLDYLQEAGCCFKLVVVNNIGLVYR